jgi:HK97 gp10 family phage protein
MTTVTLKGGKELAKKLATLSEAMQGKALEAAVADGALPIQNDARRLAPFITRTLARSIHTNVETTAPGRAEAAVGTDVIYAAQREFGGQIVSKNAKLLHWVDKSGQHHFAKSVYQPPHPYLRPALDNNIEAAKREFGEALLEIINKATK